MTPPDSQGRKNSLLPESTIQKSRVLHDPVDASMVPSGANTRNLTPSADAGNARSFRPVEASNKMMRLWLVNSGRFWPLKTAPKFNSLSLSPSSAPRIP